MKEANNYIPSAYLKFDNLELFKTNKPARRLRLDEERIKISHLMDFDRLFIIGEPGYGKSEMISQLHIELKNAGKSFLLLTGKNYKNTNLKGKVEYVIFDALDECMDFIPAFVEVLAYCKAKNSKLVITNRAHYMARIEPLLFTENFSFIRLLAFLPDQIEEFLKERLGSSGFNASDIERIVITSAGHKRESVLRVPRYLNEFVNYVRWNKLSPSQVKDLSRTDLFEKVIYFKLEADTKGKAKKNKKHLTKRVLERLSLVMEIQGRNTISKEEFITFLDQTNSNLSVILLSAVNIDKLLERVMNAGLEDLQFEHTEFQEYLAAKELVRFGHRYQTVFDLMVEPKLGLLKDNWPDVLSYAIEMDPKFISPLLAFIKQQAYLVDVKLIKLLLSIDPATLQNSDLEAGLSAEIFDTCLAFYELNGSMIDNGQENMVRFFDLGSVRYLKPVIPLKDISAPSLHTAYNQISIIEELARQGRLDLSDKKVWVSYLMSIVKGDTLKALIDPAYYALTAIDDASGLFRYMGYFEKLPNQAFDSYLYTMTMMRPKSEKVADLVIRALEQKRHSGKLKLAISNLTGELGLTKFFDFLTNNPGTLKYQTLGHTSDYFTLTDQVINLKSSALNASIKKFVISEFSNVDEYSDMDELVLSSLSYLLESSLEILDDLLPLARFKNQVSEFIGRILSKLDLRYFKKIEAAIGSNDWRFTKLYSTVKYGLSNDPKSPIIEYIKKKTDSDKSVGAAKTVTSEDKSVLVELRSLFINDKKFYNTGLIPFFVRKYEKLKEELEIKDLKYLKDVIGVVLKNYSPEKFRMKIIKSEKSRIEFQQNHDAWFVIELYFRAAYILQEYGLIKKYREKLLKTIPRMEVSQPNDKDILKGIFNLVLPLTEADVKMVTDYCISRRDDLLRMSLRSFADVVHILQLKALNPILMKLILDTRVGDWEKEEAIKVVGELSEDAADEKKLVMIFNKTTKPGGNPKLAERANSYLISTFKNKAAIDWRFAELKRRLYKFNPDYKWSGARSVSAAENEMDHPTFPNCLLGIETDEMMSKIHDLLLHSFDIRTDRMNVRYSEYLQSFIFNYLKSVLNAKVLSDIKSV